MYDFSTKDLINQPMKYTVEVILACFVNKNIEVNCIQTRVAYLFKVYIPLNRSLLDPISYIRSVSDYVCVSVCLSVCLSVFPVISVRY